ncbi:DUF7118 family protein [Halegenticoccus tardaugens]|uniref:DUF7118 family protein n=1 Tax=Halegenticoccus tardaugens TaxID=2071624 RepID=UPI00100AB23E|nr:hypothetical protein [Halegenticoccus tardaugens]
MSRSLGDAEGAIPEIEELESAAENLRTVENEIEAVGEARVEAVAAAHDGAIDLLRRYEGSATGTGDFGAYVRFQESFVDLVDDLDDDLPARDAFEEANEALDRRRLRERDFDRARETLSAAAEVAGLLDDRADARKRFRRARHAAEERLGAIDERIDRLERLLTLGEVDLDAPVEVLRDPIEAYNEAVREAFGAFESGASARDLLDFVTSTEAYPLVDYDRPPADLREYVESNPAGEKPIPKLLSFAEYSNSKLDHYVDDPAALKRCVAVNRTYLQRLSAEPLTVSWPPPSADHLRYRARELVAVVGRFAPDEAVAKARTVRDLTADADRYERLRTAAVARAEVDDDERRRIESGAVESERETLRERRERLTAALEAHPSPGR